MRYSGVITCIKNADLTESQKEQLINELDSLGLDTETGKLIWSDTDVSRLVDQKLEDMLVAQQKALYRKKKQFDAYVNIEERFTRALNDDRYDEPLHALLDSILDLDMTGLATQYGFAGSIPQLSRTILGDSVGPAQKAYELFAEGPMGSIRNKDMMEQFARMIHDGQFDESQVGQAAKAFADVIEDLRRKLNDAGADIQKRQGFLMPTTHDSGAILGFAGREGRFGQFDVEKSKAAWKDYMKQNATIYNPTNGSPFTGEQLDSALEIMFDNITSGRPDAPVLVYDVDGKQLSAAVRAEKMDALKEKLADVTGSKEINAIKKELAALENAKPLGVDGVYVRDLPTHQLRSQERNIVFNSFDSWLDYHKKMGVEDIFASMHGNIEAMANEVALMRTFGPDADKGFEYALKKSMHHHPNKKTALTRTGRQKNKLIGKESRQRAKWNVLTGRVNGGAGDLMARMSAGLGNWATAAYLGAASIPAAFGDPATSVVAASNIGITMDKVLGQYIRQAGQKRTSAMVALGLGAENLIGTARAINRYSDVDMLGGWSGKAADFFTRVSGLQHITKAGDDAFGMVVLSEIAQNINTSFDDLNPRFRDNFLAAFNITRQDWEDMTSVKEALSYIDGDQLVKESPAGGLAMFNLRDLDTSLDPERAAEIRQKVVYAINTYRDYAVLKGNVAAKAATTGGLEAGSGAGIVIRALTQFANHPITMVTTHLRMAAMQAKAGNYHYLATLAVATTTAGLLIEQTKAVLGGKDPSAMWGENGWKTWSSAFVKGGGGGFYLDLAIALMHGEDDVVSQITGPRVRVLTQSTAFMSNALDAAKNDKGFDRYMAEVLADMHGLSPTKTHPATILAHQFLVDSAIQMFDPGYASDRRRRIKRYHERERGATFWFDSRTGAQRAPDLGTIAGD